MGSTWPHASPSTALVRAECVFFTLGKCKYGNACKNVHDLSEGKKPVSSPPTTEFATPISTGKAVHPRPAFQGSQNSLDAAPLNQNSGKTNKRSSDALLSKVAPSQSPIGDIAMPALKKASTVQLQNKVQTPNVSNSLAQQSDQTTANKPRKRSEVNEQTPAFKAPKTIGEIRSVKKAADEKNFPIVDDTSSILVIEDVEDIDDMEDFEAQMRALEEQL